MAPSYYSTRSTHDHFVESPSLLARVIAGLPSGLGMQMQRLWERNSYSSVSTSTSRVPRGLRHWTERWHPRRLLSLPHLLILVWLLVLLWGERWVFESSIKACEWGRWERWVSSCRWMWEMRNEADAMNIAQGCNAPSSCVSRGSPTY